MTSDRAENVDWLRTLIGHLQPGDAAGLQGMLDGAAAPALSGMGRLVAFYVTRTRMALETGAQGAQVQMDLLRAGIAAALARAPVQTPVQTPVHAPVPAPVPAAAPPPEPDTAAVSRAVRLAYRLTVRRDPGTEEIGIWLNNFANGLAFQEFLLLMDDSPEARALRDREVLAPDLTDADFIQAVYRHVEGRGALPAEIDLFRDQLDTGATTRAMLLQNFFAAAITREARGAEPLHDGLSSAVLGTRHVLTLAEWQEKARDTEALARARAALRIATPFVFRAEPGVEITAIASLFRGGDFIEQFMDNITAQSCFDRHCELIIIDADSPENEGAVIARYLDRHPGVRYRRMDSRIGIYEAWNIGVRMSRGRYLTNTNLDDLRRRDSLEIQAGALQALPFADVVYQDFYYSFDPSLDWEGVAAFGYRSDVPVITPYNMLRFNSPHNAPMWRRTLHDELGLFDAAFQSAGDYEFWLRCLAAGKTFYKINEPHVVYYQNPKGLSTRADSRGLVESRAILRRYAPQLISRAITMPLAEFAAGPAALAAIPADAGKDRGAIVQHALRDLSRRARAQLFQV